MRAGPDTDTYRDLNRYPEALTQTNTIIVRIDAALYFANIPYLREQLEILTIGSGKNLNQIIIDAIGINEVDASALRGFKELADSYEERDIEIIFTGLKGPVRDVFQRSRYSIKNYRVSIM
ncbi:MAG: sodium-independent anion transporter [Balneolaceae bacterium]|nr:sodium-independent anion transporter [Balneolaceae bacterium]